MKRTIMAVVALLLGSALWLLLISPEIKGRKAVERYKIGMSSDEIERIRKKPIHLERSGVVYPHEPSEDDKRTGPFYSVYLGDEAVYIQFNYYREIIKIRRVSAWKKIRAILENDR